ncbi:MAG: hypothetical protein ACOYB7_06130 [Mycobacterium sp.]
MTGWMLLLIGSSAGLFFGGRALSSRLREDVAVQQERDDELRSRADQQHNWASRGDMRGVYGTEGAELMRTVTPTAVISPPGDEIDVATVVRTPGELAAMLKDKPQCWRYASFVSTMVQRRDAVADRVRDARMAFSRPNGETLRTDYETGLFFTERLSDLSELIGQVNGFMLSKAFQQAFGDAGSIAHAANRLMDYHERLLALSERSRGVRVPRGCADLQRDFGLLTALPIEGFNTFIEDFTDRVAEMGDVARYATGDVQLDNVELGVKCDDALLSRVSNRLQQLARTG